MKSAKNVHKTFVARHRAKVASFNFTPDSSKSGCSASEEEGNIEIMERKVRKSLKVRSLLKSSETIVVDDDHIYTKHIVTPVTRSSPKKCPNSSRIMTRSKQKIEEDNSVIEPPKKRQKTFSKNAVLAKLNRERKKIFVRDLEFHNSELTDENVVLKNTIEEKNNVISSLEKEVTYLKCILANTKEINMIMNCFSTKTGLPTTSSLYARNLPVDIKMESQESPEHGYLSGVDSEIEHGNFNENCYSPDDKRPALTKSIYSGPNHPIAGIDVNLANTYPLDDMDVLFEDIPSDLKDGLENPLFKFEYDDLGDLFGKELSLEPPVQDAPKSEALGICLHVNQSRVSLEFCSSCNSNALRAFTHSGF